MLRQTCIASVEKFVARFAFRFRPIGADFVYGERVPGGCRASGAVDAITVLFVMVWCSPVMRIP